MAYFFVRSVFHHFHETKWAKQRSFVGTEGRTTSCWCMQLGTRTFFGRMAHPQTLRSCGRGLHAAILTCSSCQVCITVLRFILKIKHDASLRSTVWITEWLKFEASKPLLKATLTCDKYSNNYGAEEKQKQDSVAVRLTARSASVGSTNYHTYWRIYWWIRLWRKVQT